MHTPVEATLFTQSLNTAYTTYFNLKRKRIGHLFQGRYKALLVEVDSYLLELSRYIHLNPVRARLCDTPEDYRYSSYRDYLSPEVDSIVSRELVWSMISRKRKTAPERYRAFVATSEISNPFERVYGGFILGHTPFISGSDLIIDISSGNNHTSFSPQEF